MLVRVDLTEDDIDHGVPANPNGCPWKLACDRAGLDVMVRPASLLLWTKDDRYCVHIPLPPSISGDILAYDTERKSLPLRSLEIDTEACTARLLPDDE